jgi:RNA polymerase sigma-70 factor (ECF subfamily)
MEVEFAKSRYSKEFKAAFEKTISTLSREERALLRFHYLGSMPVRSIARMYGVHHSTIARRIERARNLILNETYAILCERLELEQRELEHLLGFIESQLEVSVRRCLDQESR